MKILTYNILNPYHAVKWETLEGLDESGGDNWGAWRAEAVLSNLQGSGFDVACLQEVSAENAAWLQERFSLACHAMHETDDPPGAHGTALVYQPQTVELVRAQALRSEGIPARIGACADLRHRTTGRVIRCVSVHLKGYNPYEQDIPKKRVAQQTGDLELASYLNQARSLPGDVDGVLIAGDFNEDELEMARPRSRQAVLIEVGFEWDQVIDVTETRTDRKIDWVFYKPVSPSGRAKLSHARPDQRLEASDHALTGLALTFGEL